MCGFRAFRDDLQCSERTSLEIRLLSNRSEDPLRGCLETFPPCGLTVTVSGFGANRPDMIATLVLV
jgi:hypothetical protein